jgi:hypothetical protein
MIRSYFRYGLLILGISIFMITISLSFQTIIGLPSLLLSAPGPPGSSTSGVLQIEVVYSLVILIEAWGLGLVIPSMFLLSWGATYDDPSEIKGSHIWYIVSLFFFFGGIILSAAYLLDVVIKYA